ncbi:MAG: hypothetical protein WDO56_22635 [Gammaproteobacteria bacterium]
MQAAGITGKGVKIAVLDSGIDYTHRNLGGRGTVAAYEAAYGKGPTDSRNTTLDGLFPTDKVVGGYDFVGETWEGGDDTDRSEDPDPSITPAMARTSQTSSPAAAPMARTLGWRQARRCWP